MSHVPNASEHVHPIAFLSLQLQRDGKWKNMIFQLWYPGVMNEWYRREYYYNEKKKRRTDAKWTKGKGKKEVEDNSRLHISYVQKYTASVGMEEIRVEDKPLYKALRTDSPRWRRDEDEENTFRRPEIVSRGWRRDDVRSPEIAPDRKRVGVGVVVFWIFWVGRRIIYV